MPANEETTANIYSLIDDSVYRLALIASTLVADKNYARIIEGFHDFNHSAD